MLICESSISGGINNGGFWNGCVDDVLFVVFCK